MFDKIGKKVKGAFINTALKLMKKEDKISQLFLRTMASNINSIVLLPATHSVGKKIHGEMTHPTRKGETFSGTINGVPVTMIRTNVGSPSASIVMETLARIKPKVIIRVDFAASLVDTMRVGDVFVSSGAFPGDGTSIHYIKHYGDRLEYLKKGEDYNEGDPLIDPVYGWMLENKFFGRLPADEQLLSIMKVTLDEMGISYHEGATWTTDGLFLETPGKVKLWKQRGAIGVDMETSIIYLLSKLHAIPAIAIHGISDNLMDEKPFYELEHFDPAVETGIDNCILALKKALPRIQGT
ncbi:MAG: nucleoside phosphorylase [Promethearchaeota archaeon]